MSRLLSRGNGEQRGDLIEPLEARQFLSAALPKIVTPPPPPPVPGTSVPTNTFKGVPVTFNAEDNEQFTGAVAQLTGFIARPATLSAMIDWGDGTQPTKGAIVGVTATGTRDIVGQHTYAKDGTYTVNVIVTQQAGPLASGTPVQIVTKIVSSAIVSPDNEGGVKLTEIAGKTFTAKVGSFDFIPPPLAGVTPTSSIIGSPVNFFPLLSATIDWGDGKTTAGTIRRTGADDYDVVGTHSYAQTGTYNVHVIVTGRKFLPPSPTATAIVPPPVIFNVADFMSEIDVIGPTPATI